MQFDSDQSMIEKSYLASSFLFVPVGISTGTRNANLCTIESDKNDQHGKGL